MKNKALTEMYEGLMVAAAQYVTERKPKAQSPEDVAAIIRPLAQQNALQESFWVLALNVRRQVTKIHLVSKGLADRTQVHAREIFREAIIANSACVILAHNHPSGDPTPSPQDIDCTRNLVAAGQIIGIEVLDHVVVGTVAPDRPKDFLSFREANLL